MAGEPLVKVGKLPHKIDGHKHHERDENAGKRAPEIAPLDDGFKVIALLDHGFIAHFADVRRCISMLLNKGRSKSSCLICRNTAGDT